MALLPEGRMATEDRNMSKASHELGVFLHLAQASFRRRRPLVRDRMLLLAGTTAANMQIHSLADYCRTEILLHNPQHLVRRWPSLAEALVDFEFIAYLRQIRRRYPLEKAEQLLESLGIETANERETYYSDVEYAASILGIPAERLRRYGGFDSDAPVD